MRRLLKLTIISVLLMAVAMFAVTTPVMACDDSPGISASLDAVIDQALNEAEAATDLALGVDELKALLRVKILENHKTFDSAFGFDRGVIQLNPEQRARDVGAYTNFAPTALAVANSSLCPIDDGRLLLRQGGIRS